jgi:multidrug resistance efflux pump
LQQLTRVANEVAVPQQQYQRQRQEVLNTQAEIDRLNNEQQRIVGEITKAREELQNAIALSTKEVLSKIDNNQKRIADIDSQLKQAQQQNQQRIAQIDAELSKAQQPQYQQLKSPIDGVVFDVQPSGAGFATNTNQTLLTVVPNDGAVASVFFQDKEIGLIKEGMEVNVRVASSPQGEFGNLQGKVVWVGANVLPPSPERPYYAIPAKIQLQRPSLYMNGKSVPLQPGMQVYSQLVVPDQLTVWDVMRNKFGDVLPR